MNAATLARQDLEGRKGGIWDYVSASRLNLWLKCPLAFRLRYVDGIWTPPSLSQFLGRTVHRALETYYRRRQLAVRLPSRDIADWLLGQWDQAVVAEGVRFASSAVEAAAKQQAVDLVTTYVDQVPADEPRPLAIETALEAPLIDPVSGMSLGLPLVGIIDLEPIPLVFRVAQTTQFPHVFQGVLG